MPDGSPDEARGENDPPDGNKDSEWGRDDERRWRRGQFPLDYSPPSGATSPDHAAQDVGRDTALKRHEYKENATYIGGSIPAESDRWNDLNDANENFFHSEATFDTERQRHERLLDVQAWGSRIGLTDHEIQRAAYLVTEASEGMLRRHSGDATVLAALTLTANEGDGDHVKSLRPHTPDQTQHPAMTDTYVEIRDASNATKTGVTALRAHLRGSM